MIAAVAMEGRITINNSDQIRRKLLAALRTRPVQVTVDLSQATFIDTSAVATLLEAVRIARGQGTRLVLTGLSGQPRYLFDVVRLDTLFEFGAQETSA